MSGINVENLLKGFKVGALALGNFDGVHLGHQGIFKDVIREAHAVGAPSAALTFEPHPVVFFRKKEVESFRLTDPEHKLELIRNAGITHPIALPFDLDLAGLSPQDFVDKVLHEGLGAQAVRVGHDFNFGKGRAGGIKELAQHASVRGISIHVHDAVTWEGEVVSSTRVRKALSAGSVALVRALLGRPASLRGEVSRGDGRGKKIGFPTANIWPRAGMALRHGVYVTRLRILSQPGQPVYPGITNVGVRPTIADALTPNAETLVLAGLSEDTSIYGEKVEVEILASVREEKKFESVDALRAQIAQDVAQARQVHGL